MRYRKAIVREYILYSFGLRGKTIIIVTNFLIRLLNLPEAETQFQAMVQTAAQHASNYT